MSDKLSVIPVRFECTDSAGDMVFIVNAFDIECSEVEIKSVVTPESWPEISKQIQLCLDSMKLGEQK